MCGYTPAVSGCGRCRTQDQAERGRSELRCSYTLASAAPWGALGLGAPGRAVLLRVKGAGPSSQEGGEAVRALQLSGVAAGVVSLLDGSQTVPIEPSSGTMSSVMEAGTGQLSA